MLTRVFWLTLATCAILFPAQTAATLIRVPGDAPTIQEGVGLCSHGDTVLVAPGAYSGPLNRNIDFGGIGLALVSETGAESTVIQCSSAGRALIFRSGEDSTAVVSGFTITGGSHDTGGAVYCKGSTPTFEDCVLWGNRSGGVGGAVACQDASPRFLRCEFSGNTSESAPSGEGGAVHCAENSAPTLVRCVFDGNGSDMGGAVCCTGGSSPLLKRCLFFGNAADSAPAVAGLLASSPVVERCTMRDNIGVGGSSIYCDATSTVTVEGTIVAFGHKGPAVACAPGGSVALSCCDVYGNEYGDWVGCIAGQLGANGNICADPLFCSYHDPLQRFFVQEDSPCAPEQSPACGGIGAVGIGCGATQLHDTSWGRVKTLFLERN